jgi:archaellum biogenesis protein FlaJ (TadC family)
MQKQAEIARIAAQSVKESMLADMLDAMANFIEAEPGRDVFVFARTLGNSISVAGNLTVLFT